jgi:hypothetical protein
VYFHVSGRGFSGTRRGGCAKTNVVFELGHLVRW